MSQSSTTSDESARNSRALNEIERKYRALLLQRLSRVGQNHFSKRYGCSESTTNRMKDDGGLIENCARLLAALYMQPVDGDAMPITRAQREFSVQLIRDWAEAQLAEGLPDAMVDE